MGDHQQEQDLGQLIAEMRGAFDRREWDRTCELFDKFSTARPNRALRLEATCLAARALVATKQRAAARALLKSVATVDHKKAVHYEFLARAFLDLKQYDAAADACVKAENLRAAERTPA